MNKVLDRYEEESEKNTGLELEGLVKKDGQRAVKKILTNVMMMDVMKKESGYQFPLITKANIVI